MHLAKQMLEVDQQRSRLLLLVYHAAQKHGVQHTVFLWQGMFSIFVTQCCLSVKIVLRGIFTVSDLRTNMLCNIEHVLLLWKTW